MAEESGGSQDEQDAKLRAKALAAKLQQQREDGNPRTLAIADKVRSSFQVSDKDPIGDRRDLDGSQEALRFYFWYAVELASPAVAGELSRLRHSFVSRSEGFDAELSVWMCKYGIESEWVKTLAYSVLEGWIKGDWYTPIHAYLGGIPGSSIGMASLIHLDTLEQRVFIVNEELMPASLPDIIRPPSGLPPWLPAIQSRTDYICQVKDTALADLDQAISYFQDLGRGTPLSAVPPDARHDMAESIVRVVEAYCDRVAHSNFGRIAPGRAHPSFWMQLFWVVDVHVLGKNPMDVARAHGVKRQAVAQAVPPIVRDLGFSQRSAPKRGRPPGSGVAKIKH